MLRLSKSLEDLWKLEEYYDIKLMRSEKFNVMEFVLYFGYYMDIMKKKRNF